MLIGKESCTQHDQNSQQEHRDVREHDGEALSREGVCTGFEHKIDTERDEQWLEDVNKLYQPNSE